MSLGGLGLAATTRLENNFKVRQFPDGGVAGLTKAVAALEAEAWERNIEGLELLAGLAEQQPAVLEQEIMTVRGLLLRSIRNLRSQVSQTSPGRVYTESFRYRYRLQISNETNLPAICR